MIRFRHAEEAKKCHLSANTVRARREKAKRAIAELISTAKTGKRNSGPQNLASLERRDVDDISEPLITPHRSTLPTIPEESEPPSAPSVSSAPPAPPASQAPAFDDLAAIHRAQGVTKKGVAGGNCLFGALALNLACYGTDIDHTIVRADVCHQMEIEWNDPTAGRRMGPYLLALLDEKRKRASGKNVRERRQDYDLALAPCDSELPKGLSDASGDRAFLDFLFQFYRDKMQKDGFWGGEPEIKSAARKYQRDVHVYENGKIRRYPGDGSDEEDMGEICIQNMMSRSEVQPIRILRRNRNHYVAVFPSSVVREDAAPSVLPAKKANDGRGACVTLSGISKPSIATSTIKTVPKTSTATGSSLSPMDQVVDDLFDAMDEKTRARSE